MRFLLLALILFAAGCGSSESTEPVATTEVEMAKSYRFDPKTIEIEAGDTVTWTNAAWVPTSTAARPVARSTRA